MTQTAGSAPIESLKSIPLFADLGEDSLRRIAELCNEVDVPAGQVLVQPKLEGSGLFIIEQGTCLVESGDRKIELGPGEFFGELALLTSAATRAARVRCSTDVRCLAISRGDFTKMLHDEPTIAVHMLEVLAKRLADVMTH